MNRFALFQFDQYYPRGGWNDFEGTYETIEAAREAASEDEWGYNYSQIVDLKTEEEYETIVHEEWLE